jgi:hypothetical protein
MEHDMKFNIEQIALHPRNPEAAIELLTAIGLSDWARDHVVANGKVWGLGAKNEANLQYNYTGITGKELEVLEYTEGPRWITEPRVSHLGMHCTEEELDEWKVFFAARGIPIAQEVETESHTNPVIAGKRKYKYAIFDTFEILGVDLKFIVRVLL